MVSDRNRTVMTDNREEIAHLRQLLKMTQTEFAEALGVKYRAIQRWESGDRKCPDMAVKLARSIVEKKKGEE